ncbi:MAG TPA: pYEATS domain-containing protein [Longimicrobiales bacterium]|nr:pYEATS domain-containing protein [Longimicrobiales bacterium]
MRRAAHILVLDSALDPDGVPSRETVQYRAGDPPLYRVFLYLDGNDLPYVEGVTYHLHETFPRPRREVRRTPSNPRCKLVLWTWGIFEVRAVIRDKRGSDHEVRHQLTYDRVFSSLDRDKFQVAPPTSGSSPVE